MDVSKQKSSHDKLNNLTEERATESNAIQIPEISLPKGGGALKGIDEKFKINASNGTAAFSIPLPISQGRNGFSPSISLSYNSGNGNSSFGIGWSLDFPSIQRKTDKSIPKYQDGFEEDTFMFAGSEDLVPFLENDNGNWINKQYSNNGNDGYTIKRYRPRLEGGFARIEKIKHVDFGTYWKVTTPDNIATIYGRNAISRITDPEDATRIFSWLPEFKYDDKGNWIKYHYKSEDLTNLPNSLFEKNRKLGIAPFTNKYLKKIQYGNRIAYYANPENPYNPQAPVNEEHFFEVIFDYGEHDSSSPTPQDSENWDYRADAFSSYRAGFEIRTNRLCKRVLMFHHFPNELQFKGTSEEEPFGNNYLVKSLDIEYQPSSINGSGQSEVTYLKSFSQKGYIRKPDNTYSVKSLPAVEFEYQNLDWNKEIKSVSSENIMNAPVGLTNNYQWIDLYNEGISGILTEQYGGWYYKSNLGDVNNVGEIEFTPTEKVIPKPSFSGLSEGILAFGDLESNGEKQLLVNSPNLKGYFELQDNSEWSHFKSFEQNANINFRDSHTRMFDLTGDGQADIVVTEDNVFKWYESLGKNGYSSCINTAKAFDEEKGPAIVFANDEETIFLADMSGDGLTDIVRIRNGEICYWANKGYGKFSAKINMENAPLFDYSDIYNPQYLHLADVSGTGTTDIIYLGKNKFKAYINLSGNAFSEAHEIEPFLPIDANTKLSVIDLLGNGTSCIVWSSDLPQYTNAPMRYIDLMNGKKPHVIIHQKNNLGKETFIEYKSSTHYYLKDKIEGNPWITKLPFPVQCISKMTSKELITDVRFTTEYQYHHGYYDSREKEFRGFGMVEQIDSEHYQEWKTNNVNNGLEESELLYQKPVLTKTWFHTGCFFERERFLKNFKKEYWFNEFNRQFPSSPINISEPELPDAKISKEINALIGDEYREAFRACKGMVLRQETFALDAPEDPTDDELKLQLKPYSVQTHNCNIQLLQPRIDNKYGVFIVTESEAFNIHYERDETDYRLTHSVNTKFDELGNVLESASIVYGRMAEKAEADFQILSDSITDFSEEVLNNDAALKLQYQNAFINNLQSAKKEQLKTHIIFSENSFSKYLDGVDEMNDIDFPEIYRLRLPNESKTFEVTGLLPISNIFTFSELENVLSSASEIEYTEIPTIGIQKRLLEHTKTKYLNTDLNPLEFGFYDIDGLVYENYQLAFTPNLISEIYSSSNGELEVDGQTVNDFIELKGNYTNIDGNFWIRSGTTHFKNEIGESLDKVKARFYAPLSYEDPFGAITKVTYDVETFTGNTRNDDGYYIFIKEKIDAVNNKIQIDIFNYRTLSPSRSIDINANPSSVLIDELGMVKALAIEGNGFFDDNGDFQLEAADNLLGLKEYTDLVEIDNINQMLSAATMQSTDTPTLRNKGNELLKQATVRFVYDFQNYQNHSKPNVAASISREEHFTVNNDSSIQFGFEYSDGMGNTVMKKSQAKPGKAFFINNGIKEEKDTGTDLRWIGNGRTILNNKGNPVKQYEPYFSTTFLFEDAPELVEIGVTPILYYDSMDRMIKTEFPDGTFTKTEFDSWKQISFDTNDTVLESDWYNNRINNLIDAELLAQGKNPAKEKNAAIKSATHANTPLTTYIDSLGRPVINIEHNGMDANSKSRLYTSFAQLDTEGNTEFIFDSRGNTAMEFKHDMLGHRVYQNSMDAGERWVLMNSSGKQIYRWDNRNNLFSFTYDAVQRPDCIKIQGGDSGLVLDNIYDKVVYGEGQIDAFQNNLNGKVIQRFDTAGKTQSLQYDFKNNLLKASREFLSNYRDTPNWTDDNINDPAIFDANHSAYTTEQEFDALNRPIITISPDDSKTRPEFNETGLLEKVHIEQTDISETTFVGGIDYDAKGRREKIIYSDKNGSQLVTTKYHYDPFNFRLTNLKTNSANGDLLQDLYYYYDAVGNISEINDKAIPTKFFNNQKIEGTADYTYDANYSLIQATGREHLGQAIDFGTCDNWHDANFKKSYAPGDDMAWRNYTQQFKYDPTGNILQIKHLASNANWTRNYEYEAINNRLVQTQIGAQTYLYPHHTQHGYLTSTPHLSEMNWNFKDELHSINSNSNCTDSNAETTFYVYDTNGERVRKVTETTNGTAIKEERIYVGNIEIYFKRNGTNAGLERTSFHVMDDVKRIAFIDTRNNINDGTDQRTVRLQFSNHIGSASLEIDDTGNLITYEEYHPFGTTAYQAANKDINAASKRYRYTGKERDEESGLEYHSARYYIPWLGRWLSPDSLGLVDGLNIYRYSRNNPIMFNDPNGTQPPDDPPPTAGVGLSLEFGLSPRPSLGRLTLGPIGDASPVPLGLCDELNPDCGFQFDLATRLDNLPNFAPSGPPPSEGCGASAVGGMCIEPTSTPAPEPEPEPEERSFWDRGGTELATGGLLLVGGGLLLLTPVGWFGALVAGMSIAGGIAGTTVGGIHLGMSYSGNMTAEQDRELTENMNTALLLTSPGGLGGGALGVMITGDEEGLRTGATIGGFTEAGISIVRYGGGMLFREYQFGLPAAQGWGTVRRGLAQEVYGLSDPALRARPNLAFRGGVERIQMSHWIPQRFARTTQFESFFHRPWNLTPMWHTEHALVDWYIRNNSIYGAYRFLPRSLKPIYDPLRYTGLERQLRLMPPWILQTGSAATRGGATLNSSDDN